MEDTAYKAIAIVGAGAVMPDAPNVPAFWNNVKSGRYSISEVTPDRWDSSFYYDPDHSAPDKTYSKIGGWVREFDWDPMKWRMPLPPRVVGCMDETQQLGIVCTREALEDYGYPKRPLNLERTAVIIGNAMGGEKHYLTSMRVFFPEYARELGENDSFAALPEAIQRDILRDLHKRVGKRLPEITEDSMPGELANCLAGRIANIFNFRGPNFTTDAACASAMAAISAAAHGLIAREFDAVITGGVDHNMGVSTFVKFCKIGALSATGTRPYAEGADGFVMGEGAALFIMKRLEDAERDGDKIYAVLRGMGASSDGKGKGITAPNPAGQKLAVERGWQNAGLSPATATLIEGHGTSTAVGDVVEAQAIADVLGKSNVPVGSVALGSVKSNLGHLKGAAGAAGLLKLALALRDKQLPPSVNCPKLNPNIDFAHSPLFVNRELKPWEIPAGAVRRAGLSAFGFGGTNFHAVVEEYIPHRLTGGNGKRSLAVGSNFSGSQGGVMDAQGASGAAQAKVPLRGAMVIGATSAAGLAERLRAVQKAAADGRAPAPAAPAKSDLRAPERLAIDYGDAAELADKSAKALKALAADQPAIWKALRAQGIFRGQGSAPKVAFLYTGQGSQYVNMMQQFREIEPIVANTFVEADRVLTPILGKPLSKFIFVDGNDEKAVAQAEEDLRQTAITQPAVIATDIAMTRLMAAYGIHPDMAMGHSVGEYGALAVSGALPFEDALEAVSARGREMTRVAFEDNGRMAAVFAPIEEIERILKTIDGYVVTANINSNGQAVIGGTSKAVEQAIETFLKAGYNAVPLLVSHAFHTKIVAPASESFRNLLARLKMQSPRLPIISNVTGDFYPAGIEVPQMLDTLAKQIAAPVQFVKGLETLYNAGARVFVETGPKKALHGFAEDVLGAKGDTLALFTNHPKVGDIASFNQALCGLYAAGLGSGVAEVSTQPAAAISATFASALEGEASSFSAASGKPAELPVTITGAALGLPGTERVFDDANLGRILRGEQFIDVVPMRLRRAMLEKNITRLVKSDNGGPTFDLITSLSDVIRLAGRGGDFELDKEFGVSSERLAAMDQTTRLAIAAGLDALRDAGIPLVMHYKTTSRGTQLPDRWMLPEVLRDDTGVIFGSAFPGSNSFADEMKRFYEDQARRQQLAMLEELQAEAAGANGLGQQITRKIDELRAEIAAKCYVFDRRFLLRVLAMGHSQFAEFIGARGPNTQINCACASTTMGIGLAEDWIRSGRCRRVVVLSADDVTSDHLLGWMGAGFLATGAAATDEVIEDAALPFDRRRHGLLLGMGASALVVESAESVRERGIRPICEVLSTVTANSAFHATRLDVQHIGGLMENLIARAEKTAGISRREIAPHTVFVSHETYTPARGGSASAEINALRRVFGEDTDRIVIANTKGFTGHAMATGIEDVIAVKALETGCVPPVANFKEIDPELGALNLSKGGSYPVEYALRLAAGFGSQISLAVLRWVKTKDGVRPRPGTLSYTQRIADQETWKTWLERAAGHAAAELEVVQRTLRVRDKKAAARTADLASAAQSVTAAPVMKAPAPAPALAAKAAAAAAGSGTGPKPEVRVVAPPPAPPKPPQAAVKVDAVQERILALVVEKTGYPNDMLDLDLDLEADLGVDTVKQAELFAAIREIYQIPRDQNVKLRDFPTLRHVIGFVYDKRPDLAEAKAAAAQQPAPPVQAQAAPVAAAPVVAAVSAVVADPVEESILALVVEKTGYPKDMLDLDLDLEADLGVDTVKQAELLAAIRGVYNISRDDNMKLRDFPTLRHVIGFVYNKRPDLAEAKAAAAQRPAPPVQAQAAPVAAAPAPVAVSAVVADPVEESILALVVEKTGYPKDMLDLDLDLEADLGVDTVKQAELLAAIRGVYNISRDDNMKLRDFPTLRHVIGFVYNKRPDLAEARAAAAQQAAPPVQAQAAPVAAAPAPAAVSAVADPVADSILDLVVEKTGYPKDMLDLDLDLEADLGVDTVKQAELMAAIRGLYSISRDENMKLRDFPTLRHVIGFVYNKRPDLAEAKAAAVQQAAPPVPAQAAPVAALPATVVMSAAVADPVQESILDLVVEKTGYPKDMLDLDLDLEADLGVDTVKQAELLAAIRGMYSIPRDESMKLRDFPTLRHVIQFAHDKLAAQGQAPVTLAPAPAAQIPAAAVAPALLAPALASLEAANAIPRRVPVPMVRPALAICKPTGVTFAPGCRIVIMPDKGGAAEALAQRLQALGVEVLLLAEASTTDALTDQLKSWMAAGSVHGVYWLPALDHEGSLGDMDLAGWREALRVRVKALYATMRLLYEQIASAGTFLVSATRLGGQHGYDEAGAVAPLGGAVVGFTKTYKRERPDVLVKAVDFALESDASQVADLLIQETLRDPGAIEIGYKGALRCTIGLQEQPAADGQPGLTLDKNTVFVVTGAAGGIVSAITGDLAAASGGVFYLLDLVPQPDSENPDLKRFASDKDGLKRDLIARMQARGERATPAMIEKELAALERAQAAQKAIDTVRAAGGTAHYFSVNLTDAEAVAKVIEQVRERSGRIDVLLHAAGMERSHFLPDKDPREFDLVFDVKSHGWFNLLRAIGDMPLGATVAFSSIAGRFGNGGQADYSAANDLLCKISSSFRSTRPDTRAIAIDWTAWGGIGMATRGSIPKMMELAGIDMLPPEAGVPLIRRELTAGTTRGEIVVAQRLGILLQEFDATGGLDLDAVASSSEFVLPQQGIMIGKISAMGLHSGVAIETTLDPKEQAFLYDHQIDGTPVLPGVMGIEAFGQAALALLPGWYIEAIEAVNFLAPFKFYRGKSRVLTIQANLYVQNGGVVAECRLIGTRNTKKQKEPEVTTHFTARVRLTRQAPAEVMGTAPGAAPEQIIGAESIYGVYFHGPAYRVLERAWRDGEHVVGQMSQSLPAHHNPPERLTLLSPRWIELCFQTAGLWEMGIQDRMGLPLLVGQIRFGRNPDQVEGPLYSVVTPAQDGSFDADIIDAAGKLYLHLAGYRTVALPYNVDSAPFKVLRLIEMAHAAAD